MPRRTAIVLLILLFVGPAARAQMVGFGTTPEGDYLRTMGYFNERTAVATQINANTSIMLNEYMWSVIKNEMKENADHRAAELARTAEAYNKLHERIHDHPEALDVMKGDALNAKLNDLLAMTVSESASRYAKVPLDAGIIRLIPFKVGNKGTRFSMSRLSLKGTKKWPAAFQDSKWASYREAYQRAVDNALELAMDSKMTEQAIRDIEKAFDQLEDKFLRTPFVLDPRHQQAYSEAKEQLEKMRGAARLFMITELQPVFQEIDTYTGTTVNDLRLFMRRHNLTFAPAETPDERTVFPQLYTGLVEQRKKTTGAE